MHEKTLTALHIGNERIEQYLIDIRNEIERHGLILDTLCRQALPAEGALGRTNPLIGTYTIDEVEVVDTPEDDGPDLQIWKESVYAARFLVDTISTRGSVVGKTSSGGTTQGESRYRESYGESRNDSGETITEEGHLGEDLSTEAGGVRLPGGTTEATSEHHRTARMMRLVNDPQEDSLNDRMTEKSCSSSIGPLLEPLELMNELMEGYIREAERDLDAKRYGKAISHLNKATEKGEKREAAYNWLFEERLEIEVSLAKAYVGLKDFDSAEHKLNSLLSLAAEKGELGGLYYSIADLHRTRYCLLKKDTLLDRLEETARSSYFFALQSTNPSRSFLTQSAEIMIETCEWKGDHVAAKTYRDRHPKSSSPTSPELGDSAFEQTSSPSDSASSKRKSSEAQSLTSITSSQAVHSLFSTTQPPHAESPGTSLISAGTMSLRDIASASLLAKVQDGDVAMTNILLAMDIDVEQTDEQSGLTPLLIAAKHKHTKVCDALLRARADVHAKDTCGRNVLHTALFGRGGEDIIPLLLEHKADPNAPDEEGRTPLHYCVEHNKRRAAQYLLSRNAEKETLDTAGETALYLAIRKKKTQLVEVLLGAGAFVDRTNMPRTSKDIEFIVEEHLARLPGSGTKSAFPRQNSISTTWSGQTTQTASSARSWRGRFRF